MAESDYYKILGVDKSADADEIKKAYRKLAMKYHPDQNQDNPDAEAKFKELNEAYDVLKDPQKRQKYNLYGASAFDGSGGMGGGGFRPGSAGGFSSADFSGMGGAFSGIFEDMFGDFMGGRGRAGPGRGSDIQYTLELSLEDAFRGKEVKIKIPVNEECESCKGSGAQPGTGSSNCETCDGAGRVRQQQGMFTVERTCPGCGGTGTIIKDPCKSCHGAGLVRKEKTLKVKIPPGIDHGRRIRLVNEGEAGRLGGPRGDLYVLVAIKPHKLFRREGADLQCRVPIPVTKAALGGELEVPAIDGSRVKVKIPAGAQTGQQLRLKGKGMNVMKSDNRGDLFIELFVETPVNLDKKQQELMKKLDESIGDGESGKRNSPEASGFFNKVKDFWEDLKE